MKHQIPQLLSLLLLAKMVACSDANDDESIDKSPVCVANDEVCGDGTDNDCDGSIDEECACNSGAERSCGQNTGECEVGLQSCLNGQWSDCIGSIDPVEELCDGLDNDCDGSVDELVKSTWYVDRDGDGFGDASTFDQACQQPEGYVADSSDCDDRNNAIHPNAEEICDQNDNNCDGTVDENGSIWYVDQDQDGFGDPENTVIACSQLTGTVAQAGDCDDNEANANPNHAEVCDGIDNNCDTIVDEDCTCDPNVDLPRACGPETEVGACTFGTQTCESDGSWSACAGAVFPTTETCDNIDNDCDGVIDDEVGSQWYSDNDSDGYGDTNTSIYSCNKPFGYTSISGDCNDHDATTHPNAAEMCDSADNDCDSAIDEYTQWPYYLDADLDGYGTSHDTIYACSAPSGYVNNDYDCDDSDAQTYPNGPIDCIPITTISRRFEPEDFCQVALDPGPWCEYDSDGNPLGNPTIYHTNGRATYRRADGEIWRFRTLADDPNATPPTFDYANEWNASSGAYSLMAIGHLSDTHLFDSETPHHLGEWDQLVNSAWHLSDSYTCFSLEATVRTLNRLHKIRPLAFSIATGDLANNSQLNEIEWFVSLMSGTQLECDSGDDTNLIDGDFNDRFDPFEAQGLQMPWLVTPGNHDRGFDGLSVSVEVPQGPFADYLIDVLGSVSDSSDAFLTEYLYDKFYDPVDRYGTAGSASLNYWYYPEFDFAGVEGILDWQELCRANVDNSLMNYCDPLNDGRSEWAIGSINYPYADPASCGYDTEDCYFFNAFLDYYDYPSGTMDEAVLDENIAAVVETDNRRRLVTAQEWLSKFVEGCPENAPGCHGFTETNVASLDTINEDPTDCADGNFDPSQAECEISGEYVYHIEGLPIRVIGMDTTSRMFMEGISEGIIRRPTMEWIKGQIYEAQLAGDLVILASHHPTTSFIPSSWESSVVTSLAGSPYEYITYDPPSDGNAEVNEFVDEVLNDSRGLYRNVILHLSGHQHRNRIDARPAMNVDCDSDGDRDAADKRCGWWEVAAPSVIDAPHQFRLVEFIPVDAETLNISVTSIDYEIPAPSSFDDPEEQSYVQNLGSIVGEGRRLAYLDSMPHSIYKGSYGSGTEIERNVVLEVRIPSEIGARLLTLSQEQAIPVLSQQFAIF